MYLSTVKNLILFRNWLEKMKVGYITILGEGYYDGDSRIFTKEFCDLPDTSDLEYEDIEDMTNIVEIHVHLFVLKVLDKNQNLRLYQWKNSDLLSEYIVGEPLNDKLIQDPMKCNIRTKTHKDHDNSKPYGRKIFIWNTKKLQFDQIHTYTLHDEFYIIIEKGFEDRYSEKKVETDILFNYL